MPVEQANNILLTLAGKHISKVLLVWRQVNLNSSLSQKEILPGSEWLYGNFIEMFNQNSCNIYYLYKLAVEENGRKEWNMYDL